MSKDNRDFFEGLESWSKIKNDLLYVYLHPYFAKITKTKKKTFYVDCFSGCGAFDDGSEGSPLLALRAYEEVLQKKHVKELSPVEFAFIESEGVNAVQLKRNLLEQFPDFKECYNIYNHVFGEIIFNLLHQHKGENLLLYIDPFGVSALRFNLFEKINNPMEFNSIEVLMNFNVHAFIRNAYSILSKDVFLPTNEVSVVEAKDVAMLDAQIKSSEDLDDIAGGTYWRDIILRHPNDKSAARLEILDAYKKRLQSVFKYVLSMPIIKKEGTIPAYYMLFMTNHPVACLLMAENMSKRSEVQQLVTKLPMQGDLFEYGIDNAILDYSELKKDFALWVKQQTEVKQQLPRPISLERLLATYYQKNGIQCHPKILKEELSHLEKNNMIKVARFDKNDHSVESNSFNEKMYKISVYWRG